MSKFLIRVSLFLLFFSGVAQAQDAECPFEFEDSLAESTGADLQILGPDGKPVGLNGNWTPIRLLSDSNRIRSFGQTIGRLDVCFADQDDRRIVAYCTATLLQNNQILTNYHCTHPPANSQLVKQGFEPLEARLLMGFEDPVDTENAKYFRVRLPAVKGSPNEDMDANIFDVLGRPNEDWGWNPLRIAKDFKPGEALIAIHHPRGIQKVYSSIRCGIHASQPQAEPHKIHHTCDTYGGSSGALLLRENDLAIIGLHHQGGLNPQDGRTSNKAIRFAMLAEAINLTVTSDPAVNDCSQAARDWQALDGTKDIAAENAGGILHHVSGEIVLSQVG